MNKKINIINFSPGFKVVEFDHFKKNAGLTSFVLSPVKWVENHSTKILDNKEGDK